MNRRWNTHGLITTLALGALSLTSCTLEVGGEQSELDTAQTGQQREALSTGEIYESPSKLPYVIEKPLPHADFGMLAGTSLAQVGDLTVMGAFKDGSEHWTAPGGAYIFKNGNPTPVQHLELNDSYVLEVTPFVDTGTGPEPAPNGQVEYCNVTDTRGAQAGFRLAASSDWVALSANNLHAQWEHNPEGFPCAPPTVFLAQRDGSAWSRAPYRTPNFAVTAPFGDDVHGLAVSDDDLVFKTEHGTFFYTFDGSDWVFNNASYAGAGSNQRFVEPLAIDGDIAVLGDHQNNRVLVFKKQSGTWQQFTDIVGPGSSGFAIDVDVDGSRVLVLAHDFVDFYALPESGGAQLIQRNTSFEPTDYGRGALSGDRAIVASGQSRVPSETGELPEVIALYQYVESHDEFKVVGGFGDLHNPVDDALSHTGYFAQEVDISGNTAVGGFGGFNAVDGTIIVGTVMYDNVETMFDTRADLMDDAEGDRVWLNGGDYDWVPYSGSTPSSGTGPTGGAGDSEHYYYVETSGGFANQAGDTAMLLSDLFNPTEKLLSFDYHLYGSDAGLLAVDVFTNGSWQENVWARNGQSESQNQWRSESGMDLSGYGDSIRVRFRYVADGGYRGDVALDNIRLSGVHSCDAYCGTRNQADNCWCDDQCGHYGDCCSPSGDERATIYQAGIAQACGF